MIRNSIIVLNESFPCDPTAETREPAGKGSRRSQGEGPADLQTGA